MTLLYVKPSLSLQLVDDVPLTFRKGTIPPQMSKLMDFYNASDVDIKAESKGGKVVDGASSPSPYDGGFYPILFPSEFWLRREDTYPVNGTLKEVKIDLSVNPVKVSINSCSCCLAHLANQREFGLYT